VRRFEDEVVIRVRAGKGGPGAVSFRREKYIRIGPADGGDGGHGGSIIFSADPNLPHLNHFDKSRTYEAPPGLPGGGDRCSGKNGRDLVIRVPVGTVIEDAVTGARIQSLDREGASFIAAEGGLGGKGNWFFKSSTRRSPYFSQSGRLGEEKELRLSLKLIADIGLVGFPNAGKSTLLAKLTNAKPKIAAYPFTTVSPNLGVIEFGAKQYRIADVPGLLENAHKGVGLGLSFLKHIEKTAVIVYVLDPEAGDPEQALTILRNELKQYSPSMLKKRSLVVVNKSDLLEDDTEVEALRKKTRKKVLLVSGLTGAGMDLLKDEIRRLVVRKNG
jgi:GTP-binding protein